MKWLAPLLFLAGCERCAPDWVVPKKVAFERVAAARLRLCVQGHICQMASWCFRQSEAYCLDAGYSKTCGQMEPEGSCGVNVK